MNPLRVRVARPTDRLEEVAALYRDGLGLTELGGFAGHDGYDGVMLGVPGSNHELEFTQHVDGSPCPAPTNDNLLVCYLADAAAVDTVAARMAAAGHASVASENPYWTGIGLTYEDPDGWRVVVVDQAALDRRRG